MRTDAAGLRFIAAWEGKARWDAAKGLYFPYLDPVGLPTIYVGHLIKPGEDFSAGITEEQGLALLAADVKRCDDAIEANIKVELTQHQWNCLSSWSFNVGVGALKTSTLSKLLNSHMPSEVPRQLLLWCHAGGKRNAGLLRRREHEAALWNTTDAAVPIAPEVTDEDRARVAGMVAVSLAELAREAVEPSDEANS